MERFCHRLNKIFVQVKMFQCKNIRFVIRQVGDHETGQKSGMGRSDADKPSLGSPDAAELTGVNKPSDEEVIFEILYSNLAISTRTNRKGIRGKNA